MKLKFFQLFICLLCYHLIYSCTVIAQNNIQSVTQDGYQLSIQNYHSTIESETNFSYTVSVQLPLGANIPSSSAGIVIKLVYPSFADFVGINLNTPFGSSPGYTPVVSHTNASDPCNGTGERSVSVTLHPPNPNTNQATLVSFTVTVKVPASRAVNGTNMTAHA